VAVVLMVREAKDVMKNPLDYMTEQKWRNTIKLLNVEITEIVDFLKKISGPDSAAVCQRLRLSPHNVLRTLRLILL
jgi:hypothetical protein